MERQTGCRAFDDGNDRWEIREPDPADALRGCIARYSLWREETRSFTTRRELAATKGALQTEPGASLAELAFAAGYADQAHMTHEVRRLSRMTPAELRARLIPQGGGVRD